MIYYTINRCYKKALRGLFFLCCVFLYSMTCNAGIKFQNLDPGRVVNLPDWSNSGDVTLNVDFCTVSTDGNGNNAPVTPYEVKIYNRNDPPNDPFILTNMADPTQTLELNYVFEDVITTTQETAIPNTFTNPLDETGAANKCPGGNNSRYILTIPAANLGSVYAGNYRGRFNVDAQNSSGSKSSHFTVNITILDLIMISGLDDLLFPTQIPPANIVTSDDFCIYRNSPNTYQATLTGDGIGNIFTLDNGIDALPYSVIWDDGASQAPVTSGTALTARQNIFVNNTSCDGGASNNATIQLTITNADIGLAAGGIYTGVLTIMVAPE